ncbi:MAG: hypothetical protein K1X67_01345 [Fimbriimonadaceae bacterium]|nr:hypothetical protein [Fimbriimonadaceae bacterium]
MLIDESHLIVSIQQCLLCGQGFLSIFTEQIDWQGGDDSQARVLVSIDADEVRRLVDMPDVTEEALLNPGMTRPMLWWIHPSGQEARVMWKEGPLTILPHD